MADSSPKRTGPTNANDGKAFARPVEEENPLIIKRQDDILEDPLSIKDNVKEKARNSLTKNQVSARPCWQWNVFGT